MRDEFIWSEKYRPKTVKDTILPPILKTKFQSYVDQKNIPNLILHGTSGIGKTTIARAMLNELGNDVMIINASLNMGIDRLRTDIAQYASAVSFTGGRKYVILDEADYLNPNSVQPALRNFMEEYSKNTGFILTCNYKEKIIPALHSRCSLIDFNVSGKDKSSLAIEYVNRVEDILKAESVQYDKKVLVEVVVKYFPDFRRILNEIQTYASVANSIDSGILTSFKDIQIKELVKLLKDKNFTELRKWVAINADIDQHDLYKRIYDVLTDYMTPVGAAKVIPILGEYEYRSAFCVVAEINIMACLTELMLEAEFK